MTDSKRHDAATDERARVYALERHERRIIEREQARHLRRLGPLGPGPQYPTELDCVVDGAPVVGSPEWWEAA